MNTSFKNGETLNGFSKFGVPAKPFIITNRNGLTEYTVENDDVIICFRTDAGFGSNYSKIMWYTDKKNNRQYRAIKFLYKYVFLTQTFSNILFERYQNQNGGSGK